MKRRGMSLIEMLVLVTIMGVILSGSAILLTTLFRAQRSIWADIQQQSARARLCGQLRADAHAAASAKCDDEKSCELLLAGGSTVHYRIAQTAIHRELHAGDAVAHRETFPLAQSSAVFSMDKSLELPLVQLRLEPVAEPKSSSLRQRPMLVEAAVGASVQAARNKGTGP